MATYTQTDLIKDALVEIGVQDPEEAVPANRLAFAQRRLERLLEGLQDESLTDWDITSDVPKDRFTHMLQILTGHLAPAYGVPMPIDPQSGRALEEERGRAAIREAVQGAYIAPDFDRSRDY